MLVHVVSRLNFQSLMSRHDFKDDNIETMKNKLFCICIHNTGGYNTEPHFKQDHENVLRLWFDDCDKDACGTLLNGETYTEKAMNEEQATQIYDFLVKQKENDCNVGVVHCAAGIARSGAVGTFATEFFDADRKAFKAINPEIIPNGHVLQLLNRILWERHLNLKNE